MVFANLKEETLTL